MFKMFSDLWRYRFFIFSTIKTEFRAQFVRSSLGGLWMILQPLSQVLIFAFVLSTVMSAKLPGIDNNQYAYSIYLMSGILGWSLFNEILSRCVNLFVENANLLKKVAFPKITLVCIVVGRAIVNNMLLFLAMLVIFGFLGCWPGVNIIYLPLLSLINIMFALGLGLILGVFNVFIRDIGQVVPIALQMLFWLTPIVYVITIIPERYQAWVHFNPLQPIISGYQAIMLYDHALAWSGLMAVLALSAIMLIFALILFRKASPEMVDQL